MSIQQTYVDLYSPLYRVSKIEYDYINENITEITIAKKQLDYNDIYIKLTQTDEGTVVSQTSTSGGGATIETYTKAEVDNLISTSATNTLSYANIYTDNAIDNVVGEYKIADYSNWIWIDCVDGSDSTGDGTQNNPYKTYDYAFSQFELLKKWAAPNFELIGNASSDDTTARNYTLSAHNVNTAVDSVVMGLSAWHMHARGFGIHVTVTGSGIKKIYGGHINWKGVNYDSNHGFGVAIFDIETNPSDSTGHSLYWGFEQNNITIADWDFACPVWCNGVEGSFKGCAFKNLVINYSRLQFVAGTTPTTIHQTRQDTYITG